MLPYRWAAILRTVPNAADTNRRRYFEAVMSQGIWLQVLLHRRARDALPTSPSIHSYQTACVCGRYRQFLRRYRQIGRTSITVDVSVYAQRGVREGGEEICIKVTEAVLTYVAIDEQRRPRMVPQE